MTIPNLLLQKPSASSKTKEHTKLLEKRIQLWKEGKTRELLRDCRTIQNRLKEGKKRSQTDVTRIFSNLVLEGKIGSALKFLDECIGNNVLPPDDEVIAKLKQLHPDPKPIQPNTLYVGPLNQSSPAVFDCINETEIEKAARHVRRRRRRRRRNYFFLQTIYNYSLKY